MKKNILAIPGSLRDTSTNVQLLRLLTTITADQLETEIYLELDQLPYFNPNTGEDEIPAEVKAFRQKIAAADGVVICTPEYVFSLPGMLKNALEWTVGSVVFSDKPTALITASAVGEKAHESLLLVMKTLGVRLDDHCSLHIPGIRGKLRDGNWIHPETQLAFERLIRCFVQSVQGDPASPKGAPDNLMG